MAHSRLSLTLNVRYLLAGCILALALVATIAGSGQAANLAGPEIEQTSCAGRWYRIQQGDSWSNVAQRTGISVTALKAANPRLAQQPQGWLLVGQQLCLPAGPNSPTAAPTVKPAPVVDDGIWVTVRRGDSWAVLAARTGVSVAALQAANPKAMRPNEVLRPGDRIQVPATPEMTSKIPCPVTLEDFPLSAAAALTEFNGVPAILRSYLARCGALTADWGAVRTAPLRGGQTPELVMVAADPQASDAGPLGILAVLAPSDLGWEVLYQTGVAADVALLAAEDINADGHADVAWSDTTCGAKACFTTVHVISWIDGGFQDWIDGSTTMASASVRLADVLPEGSGQELVMSGGVVGTTLAGPQRVVTNTWGSPAGAPYELLSQEAARSDCLYHRLQDGDLAMATGTQDEYASAVAAYRSAADDHAAGGLLDPRERVGRAASLCALPAGGCAGVRRRFGRSRQERGRGSAALSCRFLRQIGRAVVDRLPHDARCLSCLRRRGTRWPSGAPTPGSAWQNTASPIPRSRSTWFVPSHRRSSGLLRTDQGDRLCDTAIQE